MMNFLRKHKIKIFLLTIFGFLAGTFVGFGSYLFSDRDYYDTVAVVNGKKIPYKLYYTLYNNAINNLRHSNQEITEDLTKQIQSEIITSLIKDEILANEATKYGIIVSNEELAQDIQSYPYFLNEKKQFDSRYYFQFLNSMRLSPKEFETYRKKQLLALKVQNLISINASKASIQQYMEIQKFYNNISLEDVVLKARTSEILNDWFENLKETNDYKVTLKDF